MASQAKRRVTEYAAQYAAETIYAEHPRYWPPYPRNIAQVTMNCTRVPSKDELVMIMVRFMSDYQERITEVS